MSRLEVVPFSDEHLDAAAALLAARHARHREAEPLLPELDDPRAAVEREWREEGASGVFAGSGYVIAAPVEIFGGPTWMRVGIAGHAVDGDPETVRDLYAAAASRWVDEGYTKHAVFVPSHDGQLVDAWFRLCFGASAALAMRETAPEEPFDAGATIRHGAREDYPDAARLELEMSASMQPSPSFSDVPLQTLAEVVEEWNDGDDEVYELFVAERDGRIVGQFCSTGGRPICASLATASTSRRPRPSRRRAAPVSAAR